MKSLLLLLVRAYQLGVSPYLGQNCRFYPTCSNYAREAIGTHGAVTGSVLAVKRLCKCHPWHAGGVDPVPAVTVAKDATGTCVAADRPDTSAMTVTSDFSPAAVRGCSPSLKH